ncbi:MAG TPA: hypothetical protein V6C72_06315 [Chroococcales cyanobacterium]
MSNEPIQPSGQPYQADYSGGRDLSLAAQASLLKELMNQTIRLRNPKAGACAEFFDQHFSNLSLSGSQHFLNHCARKSLEAASTLRRVSDTTTDMGTSLD